MAQDDYYYEIQLTNKQLVFYFMAGSTGLILAFLAGVMVGRGVDAAGEVQAARATSSEERIVEETPVPVPASPAEEFTYAQRLESEKPDLRLDGREPPKRTPPQAAPRLASPFPTRAATAPAPAATRRPAAAPAPATPAPASGSFTLQVGAFKDGAAAESVLGRLKEKGFAAYVVPPAGPDGLFNVRVGTYPARADAERVQAELQKQNYKPFVVKK